MANCPSKLISRIYLVGKSDWRQSCKEKRKERKVETEAEKETKEREISSRNARVREDSKTIYKYSQGFT